MKIVTFDAGIIGRGARSGALIENERIVDLQLAQAARLARAGHPRALAEAAATVPSDVLTLLAGGEPALDAAREAVDDVMKHGDAFPTTDERGVFDLSDTRLRSPLPRPNSLRDFMVVEEHVRNSVGSIPEEWFNIPAYYKGNVDEVYGPDDLIPWPSYTDKLDYELEVGAVIGRAGRRITAERAADHIVGYTLYNDWSARDIQFREMSIGIGPGMGKDFATSFGPCIATPDEFDRDSSKLEARVNGDVWSTGKLGTMRFSFEEIIEWISNEQTLQPGDILGSGTVGRGCGLELDKWIPQDAVVELSAEGIGTLRNYIGFKGKGPHVNSGKIQ